MKLRIRIIAAAVFLALAPLAAAQEAATNPGQSRVTTRLATSFTPLAGSTENARALVTALRNGTEVTLLAPPEGGTGDPVATTITPPTKPMGWGNVSHTLSLAQDSLARLGITDPTNAELQAALMGGEVTLADGSTSTLRGILQMRADGMGWGNIARATGTTMGAVVSTTKAMQGKPVATVTTAAGSTTAAKAAKSPSGITTAAGASAHSGRGPSKGITTASGAAAAPSSRGLVTAEGSVAGHGRSGGLTSAGAGPGGGNAYGRGMVTAAGGSVGAGAAAAAAHGRGAGLVSATGASAGSNPAISSAGGSGNGNGHGNGHANGKGKGG